jgi:hypothetical protein
MKDDLRNAIKTSSGNDKAALNLLSEARNRVEKSSTAYREAISQGMPAYLQNKTLAEVSPEELLVTYKALTPNQRASMRSWIDNTDSAALSVLDKQVFDDFVSKARTPNATGVETVNLELMAKNWRGLNAVDKDALATALGTNAGEFTARMRDATAFNNRIRVAQPTVETSAITEAAPSAARLAGATVGYGAHQGVMLSADIAKQLLDKTKLTDEQLMKLFLSNEGADFLKTQKLTPGSAELLDKLTKVTTPTVPATGVVQQTATQVSPYSQEATIGAKNIAVDIGRSLLGLQQPVQPELPPFQMVEDEVPQEQAPVQPEQQQPAFQMVD